jgi:S1-C subfamily serine protease
LKDEREFEAQVVGADPDSDLSVLRIVSKEPLPAIEMGSSDDLMIGETVIAIGNPFGFSHTVTTGVISANNRSIRTNEKVYHDFIQIDASINPGNSGGPLLNINGELIGINTAIYAKAQGIGFAIPINKAKRIISDLIQYGEVIQAWIGITVQDLDEKLANYMKTAGIKGALVKKIELKSPAGKAGVQDGDIILSLGTRSLHSSEDYRTVMKSFATGDRVKIRVLRDGQELTFYVKASKFPGELAMNLAFETFGVKVEDLTFNKRLKYKTYAKEGVVISELKRQSYLYNIGARPGDVIRQIGGVIIKNKKDFTKAVVKYRQKRSVVILLQRGNQSYYITIRL